MKGPSAIPGEIKSSNGNELTPVDERVEHPANSHIDPKDPAAPYYYLLARLRSPLTLRELMIQPVRSGYIGQGPSLEPIALPPSAEQLYPNVRVSEFYIASQPGPIRCQLFQPQKIRAPAPMLLYIHGGGFTVGQSEDTAYITSRICDESDFVVVSVNYRLAPEWPFPAGLEDCIAVLDWMRTHASEIGGDQDFLIVGGDSAGGNIAAALTLKARDEQRKLPEGVLLLCPLTDFFVEQHESFERLAPLGIVYDTAFIGYVRGAYVVHYRNWTNPYASPARGDLSGYPPTLIVAGGADPMIDDNQAFAKKLKNAGSRVELFVRNEMPHGYYFFPHLLKEGDEAFDAIRKFLGRLRMLPRE
jgi:acetyl esterase